MSFKKIISVSLLICLIAGLSSCMYNVDISGANRKTLKGDSNVTSKEVSLTDSEYELVVEDVIFTGSNVKSNTGKITIDESLNSVVTLKTDKNILDTIDISVSGNRITVRGDKNLKYNITEFEMRIGAKVNDFKIDGGFELKMDVPSITEFSGNVNGAVDANMIFDRLERFSLNVNGAGSINIKGEAVRSTINLNGAGNIEAFNFRTESTGVIINGAGNCEVYVTDVLDTSVNGVGSVTYDGDPKTINKNKNLLGSVKKR